MPHFAKPAEGSWTEHYPQLGTAPVSYEDSISPEYYERERSAIFSRSWLNVGRIEQLARVGSYFTREIDAARTSVIIVRAPDGVHFVPRATVTSAEAMWSSVAEALGIPSRERVPDRLVDYLEQHAR